MRPVVFVGWSVRTGRTTDLAPALGAEPLWIGIPRKRRRWLAPLRYVTSTFRTAWELARLRPRAVFVQAPPLPLTVLALLYARLAGATVAIDAHTGAVLSKSTGTVKRGLRAAARFATVTIVTNSQLTEALGARVRTVILHDPITPVECAAATDDGSIVAPLSWEIDEPFGDIVEAARQCPDVRFKATGKPPATVQATVLPANLELTGYVSAAEFDELLCRASAVLALTTREATMQRAGYEGMARGKPVIASGTRVLREFFADAGLYASSGDELAAAVARLKTDRASLTSAMVQRRAEMQRAFDDSVADIRARMRLA